ncbi:hypothetical protein NDA14_005295 [Ustilago hordei]|nr:hypothetical protein NDA14_005295 [Ustilago hordei]
MDVASSSSGAYYPANDAKPGVPSRPSGFRDFEEYAVPSFEWKPEKHTLTKDQLDRHFGDQIHYRGKPVLFTGTDPKIKVRSALSNYKEIWLINSKKANENLLINKIAKGYHRNFALDKELHKHILEAQKFGLDNGKEAQGLIYGRPFDKRKGSIFRPYKVPEWEAIEKPEITVYDLKNTRFRHLRSTLDQYNYLKIRDSARGKLLGFKLDKDGGVLFKDLSHYLGRA